MLGFNRSGAIPLMATKIRSRTCKIQVRCFNRSGAIPLMATLQSPRISGGLLLFQSLRRDTPHGNHERGRGKCAVAVVSIAQARYPSWQPIVSVLETSDERVSIAQ